MRYKATILQRPRNKKLMAHTSLDRRKDTRPVKFVLSFKVAFLELMDFRTQWNVYQMKGEDLGLHFILVFRMDIHYALLILISKSLFWFLATSVFFPIQTCVNFIYKLFQSWAIYRINFDNLTEKMHGRFEKFEQHACIIFRHMYKNVRRF